MSSRFDKAALVGLNEAKAAMRKIEPALRDKLADAAETTARIVAFQARQRVRVRFGILAAHISYSVSRKTATAKVGIGPRETITLPLDAGGRRHGLMGLGRGTETPTHIAHNVEFGHGGPHPAPPHPFLLPAAEAERENFLHRVRQAGLETEQVLGAAAATGGGLL